MGLIITHHELISQCIERELGSLVMSPTPSDISAQQVYVERCY